MNHRMGKRSIGLVAAAAGLAVAALTGCSQTAAGAGQPGMGQQGAAPVHTRAAAYTKPLVIVQGPNGTFQPNFSPFQGTANNGTYGPIYQTLFYFNTMGPQVYPELGTSYRWSNGNKTLTVTLRRGVKWSDGKPFTSADVLFTFNLLKKYPAADVNGNWSQLSSVQSKGPYEVVFNYKAANVPFSWYTLGQTYIVPQHIWAGLGDPTKVSVAHPVGTGPYVLSSFSAQSYTFSANPNYWGGEPAVRTLQFPAYTSNDSADLALARGNIDWSGIFIPNVQNVYASRSPHNKYWFPPQNIVMLYTNLKNSLLGQLAVRKAISYAINRQQISQQGEYGYEPVASPTGLVLPNNRSWLDPKLPAADKSFTYSPSLAVQTLEKAGFKKNSQGIFVSPSGEPLSFTLQVVSGWTDWDTDCQLISQQLKQVGIQVDVHEEQFGAYFSNLQNHKFDMAISWTNPGPSPYYLYQSMLAANGGWNLDQWNNPLSTRYLNQFSQTSSPAVQKSAINALQRQMAEFLPGIPLVYGATWYEYNDANVTGWPTAKDPYAMPAPWSYPAMAVVLTHLRPR